MPTNYKLKIPHPNLRLLYLSLANFAKHENIAIQWIALYDLRTTGLKSINTFKTIGVLHVKKLKRVFRTLVEIVQQNEESESRKVS